VPRTVNGTGQSGWASSGGRPSADRRELCKKQASERASVVAAAARRDALRPASSELPEYKSDSATYGIPGPPLDTPPSRGSSYHLPACSPDYSPPPAHGPRATSAEELRERFRNVGLDSPK